jgi:AmmeMemoRadiSam system protein B
MAVTLPRLRFDLDFIESPIPEQPGVLIRDPHHYSDAHLVLPPALIPVLEMFDGKSTDLDLKELLVRITGQFDVLDLQQEVTGALSEAGFLEDDNYRALRDATHADFAEAPVRVAIHAGGAYPDDPREATKLFESKFAANGQRRPVEGLVGIAAPHVSPDGGWESYCDAYGAIPIDAADKTFVILGTSHFGQPERFGLTRKPFLTPLGEARNATDIIDELAAAAPGSVIHEDYMHATEHTIEFQVVFLQHLFGPGVRIAPILCGGFARSLIQGGLPEDDEHVRRFLGALGELHARRSRDLVWVLGVDMAHVGQRYSDPFNAYANRGEMLSVTDRDKERIAQIEAGSAEGFWDRVRPNHDDLKWCGSAPFYTFLKAVPQARGRMLRYQHWQIDPHSVVSFAAMAFTE